MRVAAVFLVCFCVYITANPPIFARSCPPEFIAYDWRLIALWR